MPFQHKTGEETCLLNNNRKKNRGLGNQGPSVFQRNSKDDELERIRQRQQKKTKQTSNDKSRRASQRRSFTPRPLQGHHTPSPKASPRRFGHAYSDYFSFGPPVETSPSPSARKTAGIHCPGSGSSRSLREYLNGSLWSPRTGRGCCTPTPDTYPPSPVGSFGESSAEPFAKHGTTPRDSTRRYSENFPITVDAFIQKLEDHEELSTGHRSTASLLPPRRNCQTPDTATPTSNFLLAHSIEIEGESGRNPSITTPKRNGGASVDQGHLYKRCQYLEAEVEYLRDRETELRDRVCQQQSEKTKMTEELKALDEKFREAMTAKQKAQEAYSDQIQSFNRLHAAYNQKAQEAMDLKMTLDKERTQWMESMQAVQEELEKERHRADLYKAQTPRGSDFSDTTDTDISLNDFFEDGCLSVSPDFRAANLSSSRNNSPGLSPRTLDDMRVENKRLLEENKKLREECDTLQTNQRVYRQKQKLDTLKLEGNKAFQAGRYEEALRCYSEALEQVNDDPHMQAVLHSNKAATLYNMERFLGAIVSCCCAIHCDRSYLRAYQRRASAYEAISDFSSAAQDLSHLINSGSSSTVAREAQLHLTELQRKLKRSRPVDAYKILGLHMSATPAEIKTQYRKLALLYHPDKALDQPGAAEAFKLISQAHSMLSDESKRRRFDASYARLSRSPQGQY